MLSRLPPAEYRVGPRQTNPEYSRHSRGREDREGTDQRLLRQDCRAESAAHIGLQPNSEDVALETLIEPELLIAASQPRQVFRHIGSQFGH